MQDAVPGGPTAHLFVVVEDEAAEEEVEAAQPLEAAAEEQQAAAHPLVRLLQLQDREAIPVSIFIREVGGRWAGGGGVQIEHLAESGEQARKGRSKG